jgi:hypothetical protein
MASVKPFGILDVAKGRGSEIARDCQRLPEIAKIERL